VADRVALDLVSRPARIPFDPTGFIDEDDEF
jgi:hypothetical protein